MAYVAVLGAELFQFLCGVVLYGFFAEDKQKPKLVSAHPQISQALNPKKFLLWSLRYLVEYLFVINLTMAALLNDT